MALFYEIMAAAGRLFYDGVLFLACPWFQELLSLAKRKRVDAGEQDEPVNKPAASTDSETSDSDDEVKLRFFCGRSYLS